MSFYVTLEQSRLPGIEIKTKQTITSPKKQIQVKKIQRDAQESQNSCYQILQLQNQNRKLRECLSKRNEQIAYLSIKSIEFSKKLMESIVKYENQMKDVREKNKNAQELEAATNELKLLQIANQKQQITDVLIKKVQKYKKKSQILNQKVSECEQTIKALEINKKCMEDRHQSQIEILKQKSEQVNQKLNQILKLSSNNEKKDEIQNLIENIKQIIKYQ